MKKVGSNEWMSMVVDDEVQREREFRKASVLEAVFSVIALGQALLAIWMFTAPATIFYGISNNAIGGVAVLCFSACMAIAASGGIKKRFIALIVALESHKNS